MKIRELMIKKGCNREAVELLNKIFSAPIYVTSSMTGRQLELTCKIQSSMRGDQIIFSVNGFVDIIDIIDNDIEIFFEDLTGNNRFDLPDGRYLGVAFHELLKFTFMDYCNCEKQLYNERLAEGVSNNIKPYCDAMMAYAYAETVKSSIALSSMIEQKKYERSLHECLDYMKLGEAVSQGLLDGINRCTFVDSMKTPDGHKLFKINGGIRNLFCSGFDLKHKESIKTGEFVIHSEYPIYVDKIINSLYVLDYYGVRRDLEFISDYDNRMQVVIGDVYFMFSLRFPSSLKYTELRSFMKGKKGDYTLIDCEIGDMSEHLKNLSKFITDDVRNAGYGIKEVKLDGDILRVNCRGVRYTKCCYSNLFGSYPGKYILFETDSFGYIKVQYSNTNDSYFIRYKDSIRVEFLGKTDKVDIYSVGDTGIYVHMY